MQTAYHFLASYFSISENSVKDIQYKQLLEWTKGCLYFNHVTNLVDRSTISMYLDEYIGQFLFEQHNPFRSQQLSRKALEQVINSKTDELRNLPEIKAGKVMLSPAADRLLQMLVSTSTLVQVKSFSTEAGALNIQPVACQSTTLARADRCSSADCGIGYRRGWLRPWPT